MNTVQSQRSSAVGTTESKYFLFWEQVAKQTVLQVFSSYESSREGSVQFKSSRKEEVLQLRKRSPKKRISQKEAPLLCNFPIYMKEQNLSSSFSAVMMTLSIIITFSFFGIFFLLCCLVSGMGRLTSDFELISGIVVVKMYGLSSSDLTLLFTQLDLLICLLFILTFG